MDGRGDSERGLPLAVGDLARARTRLDRGPRPAASRPRSPPLGVDRSAARTRGAAAEQRRAVRAEAVGADGRPVVGGGRTRDAPLRAPPRARAAPRRDGSGGGGDQRERGDTEKHAQDQVGGDRRRGGSGVALGTWARNLGQDLDAVALSRATAVARRRRDAPSRCAAARDVECLAKSTPRRIRGSRLFDGSSLASRGFQRQAPAALQVPDALQRVDEFSDGGVSAVASPTAAERRRATPEKFERGVRRTALGARSTVYEYASRAASPPAEATAHALATACTSSTEASRPAEPASAAASRRRRRRENASLRGFLRDGVQRAGTRSHAGRRVVARAHGCRATSSTFATCDHERERMRVGRARRTRPRGAARRSRATERNASRGRRRGRPEGRRRGRRRIRLGLVSCPNLRRPLRSRAAASASARCDASTRAEGAAVVRRAFVSR